MKKLNVILLIATAILIVSCTNSRNTALTRSIQAFKARYNTYYNATLAFKDGRLAQEEGNKDNCTEPIPVYMQGNKTTVSMGKGSFDTAVEKCQKDIKQHSITKRPKWTKNRPKTPKDRLWLSQKEYNPFLHRAWTLMGESQFRKGEFLEAASTFAYMQILYATKPNILARARLMEAKCYAELGWYYDAEDLMTRAVRDSFPTNLNTEKAKIWAELDARQKRYESAISNLQIAVKKEKRALDKSRMYFLLGQLCHKAGRDDDAYAYFTKVIRRNPPYELEFNARIQRTEAVSKGKAKQMIRRLKAMSKNPKNKDYLDQVFYAIGNIYATEGDTLAAIAAYEEGVEKATRSGIEKGVLLVHLGQLCWDKELFVKAQKYYSQALGLFDKEHEDYRSIDERCKILEELLPHATDVELQDSLQRLAAMDSVSRMKIINKMIADLKKKEKEEQRKAMEAEQAKNDPNRTNSDPSSTNPREQRGAWYFYNKTTVDAGKRAFEQKWGKRKNSDHWRRNNKTVLGDLNGDVPADSLLAMGDSLAMINDSIEAAADSVREARKHMSKEERKAAEAEDRAKDPHFPEFYLKDIPFTEEQMEESNNKLADGLFGSAVIYKDRMGNLPLAERTFLRLLLLKPEYEKNNEVFYNMFQLYSRMDRRDDAADWRERLITEFADDPHAKLIADPDFEYKARYGKQIEDSLYQQAYEAFKVSDYDLVLHNNQYTAEQYPNGDNRPRFMFFSALSHLEMGDPQNFLADMKAIVEQYPQSSVSELAGLYVKGLKDGRLLASGKFQRGDIWDRAFVGADGDSLSVDTTFSDERNCDFVFCIAFERDSVNENQLLYEIARYNFTNFSVRNFDLSFVRGNGIDMLQTRTFLNYDEAYIYLHRLLNDEEMAYKLEGLRLFIISEDNLKRLGRGLSFSDYFDFYNQNFDRHGSLIIEEDEPTSLDEPTELPEPVEEEEEGPEADEDNFIF